MRTIVENPPRPWWPGDIRVGPFMIEFRDVLEEAGLDEETKVKIYNKAYVSVYDATTKYDNPNATKKRCHKLLATI